MNFKNITQVKEVNKSNSNPENVQMLLSIATQEMCPVECVTAVTVSQHYA